ncbi:hypothetical protein [Burkholderia dolosa]|uniref:hypothetical protein n=1 Tax=Burkholderia dolosa TaxID=152500 RepID=UPI0015915B76|nr:hypothetical protein [Burkholderia dolosa]MBR8457327.1 hypothetical protein [Burkholderia dolosa]MBY4753357.1 hypothetical protein [Burkholderia dolosa]MDN7419881.1 hypothetical protein [Burkholderia dolosa]
MNATDIDGGKTKVGASAVEAARARSDIARIARDRGRHAPHGTIDTTLDRPGSHCRNRPRFFVD